MSHEEARLALSNEQLFGAWRTYDESVRQAEKQYRRRLEEANDLMREALKERDRAFEEAKAALDQAVTRSDELCAVLMGFPVGTVWQGCDGVRRLVRRFRVGRNHPHLEDISVDFVELDWEGKWGPLTCMDGRTFLTELAFVRESPLALPAP